MLFYKKNSALTFFGIRKNFIFWYNYNLELKWILNN